MNPNDIEIKEKVASSGTQPSKYLTLQKAIELGEFQPQFLNQYPEFQALSRHAQFQLIRQALDNRERQILTHWGELNNVLNFSEKPELQPLLDKLDKVRKALVAEKERLYMEFAEAELSDLKTDNS